jgi:hypothetical protein
MILFEPIINITVLFLHQNAFFVHVELLFCDPVPLVDQAKGAAMNGKHHFLDSPADQQVLCSALQNWSDKTKLGNDIAARKRE